MFSATQAARFLDEAHRARARYQNLPEAIAPKTFDDAYAAQEALCALWLPRLGAVAGRKIAVTTKTGRHERNVIHVPGDPARPFGEAELRSKFQKLVEPVPADQADGMFTRALEALDEPAGLPRDIEMIDADR